MKRLMKRALTFGALLMMLASALPAGAQSVTKNSVKLKDGTVIRGQVQRTENGVNVTTEDGLFVYSNDELQPTKVELWGKPHGFQASVGGGFLYSSGYSFVGGGPEAVLGYRFNSTFWGIGGGYIFGGGDTEWRCLLDAWNIYLQGNYYFKNNRRQFYPYVGMMCGVNGYDECEVIKICFRGLLGFEYRLAKSVSFNMALGPGCDFVGVTFTARIGLTFCASK
jgi:hypothetical protein